MKDVGSAATPEVIGTWVEVGKLFQEFGGERRERLQQVADRLGVSFKVARRRLRNYEALTKTGRAPGGGEVQPRQVRQGRRPTARTGFRDRVLTCADCGAEFTWGAGEQEYFREKGLTSEPKRCKDCRRADKERRAGADARKGRRK